MSDYLKKSKFGSLTSSVSLAESFENTMIEREPSRAIFRTMPHRGNEERNYAIRGNHIKKGVDTKTAPGGAAMYTSDSWLARIVRLISSVES